MIWRALTPDRAMQLLISLLSDSRKMPSVVPTSTMADTSSRLMEAWLPWGEDLGDQFREQHQGIGDEDEHADDPGGRQGQGSPIGGADGLGDNLREHEDQESEDGRYQPEILLAEDLDGLRSHAGRTDGVGDGVEREDGAHGAIDVVFVLLHQRGGLAALVLPHRDVGHRRGEEHRFEDGAKKGK